MIRGKCLSISYDTYLLLWQLTTCRAQENQNTCVTESRDVVFQIETNCRELFINLINLIKGFLSRQYSLHGMSNKYHDMWYGHT